MSRMLKRAISQGVNEKDLAAVLNVRVDRIRQTYTLLEREATSEYLSQNYPEMVKEVQKIFTHSETEVLS